MTEDQLNALKTDVEVLKVLNGKLEKSVDGLSRLNVYFQVAISIALIFGLGGGGFALYVLNNWVDFNKMLNSPVHIVSRIDSLAILAHPKANPEHTADMGVPQIIAKPSGDPSQKVYEEWLIQPVK